MTRAGEVASEAAGAAVPEARVAVAAVAGRADAEAVAAVAAGLGVSAARRIPGVRD